jgi:hypothetical protein
MSKEHREAQVILMNAINTAQTVHIQSPLCERIQHWPSYVPLVVPEGARAFLEKSTQRGVLFDVVVYNIDMTPVCGFEVFHTHRTNTPRDIPWFEFEATKVILARATQEVALRLKCIRYENRNKGCGPVQECAPCALLRSEWMQNNARRIALEGIREGIRKAGRAEDEHVNCLRARDDKELTSRRAREDDAVRLVRSVEDNERRRTRDAEDDDRAKRHRAALASS